MLEKEYTSTNFSMSQVIGRYLSYLSTTIDHSFYGSFAFEESEASVALLKYQVLHLTGTHCSWTLLA